MGRLQAVKERDYLLDQMLRSSRVTQAKIVLRLKAINRLDEHVKKLFGNRK
jgi:hypothetical protein